MESPPSLEMLKGAVQALYHDPQKATEANRWLTEFQSSPFAWNLAKDITSGKEGTFSTEFAFFAANVLVQKARRDVHQLRQEDRPLVRDELLRTLASRSCRTGAEDLLSPAERRLCLAIALLLIYAPETGGPSFIFDKSVISHLPRDCFISIATALPEEIAEASVSTMRKDGLEADLRRALSVFVEGAGPCVDSSQPARLRADALRCFQRWAPFGLIPTNPLLVQLFDRVLQCLFVAELFCPACECVAETLGARGYSEESLNEATLRTAGYLVRPEVSHLLEQAKQMDNSEIYIGFANVASAAVIASVESLYGQPVLLLSLCEMMFHCTEHWDKKVAELAIDFWEGVNDTPLLERPDPLGIPLLHRLLQSISSSIAYPADFTTWDDAVLDKDEFERYRRHAKDLLLTIGAMLKGAALDVPLSVLNQSNVSWQHVEACLFAVGAIAGELSSERRKTTTQLSEQELHIFNKLKFLLDMFNNNSGLVEGFSKWISSSEELTMAALGFVCASLFVEGSFKDAAKVFLATCSSCSATLSKSEQTVHQLISVLSEEALVGKDSIGRTMIAEGVSRVVAKLPGNVVLATVEPIIEPIRLRSSTILPRLATAAGKDSRFGEVLALSSELRVFGAVVKYLEMGEAGSHPAVVALEKIWEVFESLRTLDIPEELTDAVAIALSSVIRAGKSSLYNFIGRIMDVCQDLFQRTQHHHLLGVFTDAVERFGEEEGAEQVFSTVLSRVIAPVTSLFQNEHPGNHPDLVASFFNFIHRHMLYCPGALLQLAEFARYKVFELAVVVIRVVRQRDPLVSTSFFLARLLSPLNRQGCVPERFKPIVSQHLGSFGHVLITSVLESLVEITGADVVGRLGECLFSLAERIPEQMHKSVFEFLGQHPAVSATGMSDGEKAKIMNLLLKFRSERRYRSLINDFARILKGELETDVLLAYEM